jgi:hypothetical protein
MMLAGKSCFNDLRNGHLLAFLAYSNFRLKKKDFVRGQTIVVNFVTLQDILSSHWMALNDHTSDFLTIQHSDLYNHPREPLERKHVVQCISRYFHTR